MVLMLFLSDNQRMPTWIVRCTTPRVLREADHQVSVWGIRQSAVCHGAHHTPFLGVASFNAIAWWLVASIDLDRTHCRHSSPFLRGEENSSFLGILSVNESKENLYDKHEEE